MNIFKKIINHFSTGGHPYKKSRRKKIYEEIAKEYKVTPDRVYEIAHHVSSALSKEEKIVKELIKRGIVVKKTRKKKPINIEDIK